MRKDADLQELRRAWADYKAANPGMTQEKFAGQLGISQGMLSHWLSGRKPVSLGNLLPLAKKLGRTPAQIAPKVMAEFEAKAEAMQFARKAPPLNDLTPTEKALIARTRYLNGKAKNGRDYAKVAVALLEALAVEAVPDEALQHLSASDRAKGR